METSRTCLLAAELAAHIRLAHRELGTEWLERAGARHSVAQSRAGPTSTKILSAHAPLLVSAIADYLEDAHDPAHAEAPVAARAAELAGMRFTPGFDAGEILREYEVLGSVLYSFTMRVVAASSIVCTPDDVLLCGHRIFRAVSLAEQVTTARYLSVLNERVGRREERLLRFNRMITHELKNRVGATLGAGQLLQEEWLEEDERSRFASMVTENAQAIQNLLENLIALSRLDGERRRQRCMPLRDVVVDVVRQLHDAARSRDVELRIPARLPDIDVNAAAVELCLSNYVSNGIKYSDSAAAFRWVEITAAVEALPGPVARAELVVRVEDNGVGVPDHARARLFERYFRAHADSNGVEGTGLGLNLVLETAESLGGRAWAQFGEPAGSVFAFALPCRRAGEPGHVRPTAGLIDAATLDVRHRTGPAPMTMSD